MRVVVVGGTGNISVAVVRSLLDVGHEVTIYNRGRTDRPVPKGVRVLLGDRHDRPAFEATMQAERFDAAIDMICYTADDAASDLRAFRGVRHLIHTSTVAVFGGPLAELPTTEDSPRRPVIPYGEGKVAADAVFAEATARGELPITVFMPAQTWGYQPILLRQLDRDPRWIDRIRTGKPILVTHEGELIWPNLHSDDAGVAYAAAVGRERCFGQTYILTGTRLSTWREYHEGVAEAIGSKATLVDAPAEWLIKAWSENTRLLASESRWNRIYSLERIKRDIPEFKPTIRMVDRAGELVRSLDERGLIEDARSDETEDRLIAEIDRLGASVGAAR
jgi:nucleoside-diphosphate-sugar epimerase